MSLDTKSKIEIYEAEYEALLRLENSASDFYKVWNNKRFNLDLMYEKVNVIKSAFSHLDKTRRALGLELE